MWDAHDWKTLALFAVVWGFGATFVSWFIGYRRYVRQEDEREKRCSHTLDVDERIVLLEALNIAKNALRDGVDLPSDYEITREKLDDVYKLVYWAEGVELKAPSPFDEATEPGRL
jgi:hypothetical protein